MTRASAARKLAAAAAYGGGGLGLIGGSLFGLLTAEAKLARRRIGNATAAPPDPSGLYGAGLPGRPLRLAVLGDSAAAGYGAEFPAETFGAFLAAGLSDLAGRPVYLSSVAVVGAKTTDLRSQIPHALASLPDVCAVIIGTNDVTHQVLPSASVRNLHDAVETMRGARTQVVVGTCPDLGTIRPIAPPLRQVARAVEPAARRRPDRRRGRGRRSLGLARHHPRSGVLRGSRRHVRAGPLPPLPGRLQGVRCSDAAHGRRGRRRDPSRCHGARAVAWARGSTPCPPPLPRPPRTPARRCRRRLPTSPVRRGRAAAAGSSCGTGAATPIPEVGEVDRSAAAATPDRAMGDGAPAADRASTPAWTPTPARAPGGKPRS